jgi:hypothetical protein
MYTAKQKRLENGGWKVGTVKEFLNLSPAESAYVEFKLSLSENFLKYCRNKKLTQEQVARLLKSSQS